MADAALTSLLESLPDDVLAQVEAQDPVVSARAILEVVAGTPPLSSTVARRSRLLALARARLLELDEVPDALDVHLLAAVARTAFAAHESTAAMTATEQAVARATELREPALVALLLARRVPWLSVEQLDRAGAELTAVEELIARHPAAASDPSVAADLCLAKAAVYCRLEEWDEVRQALAGIGRSGLPRDERLHFYAIAAQTTLAQVAMRTGQRVEAVKTLINVARVAAELGAWAELANIQTLVAAYGVRTGAFETAISHAESALGAMEQSTLAHAQIDPWLGLPLDISAEPSFADAIRNLAESVVQALDRSDRIGFLVASCALVAFYLVADRAPEALDALNEAIEAAREMGDQGGEAVLRSVSESLLRFMGVLQ